MSQKIAIVDGMVLVQKMTKKTGTITTVKDLGQHFNDKLMTLTAEFDEIILVFDTFDTYKSDSLKQKTIEQDDDKAKIPSSTKSWMTPGSST